MNVARSGNDIKNLGVGSEDVDRKTSGSAGEVFRAFLNLGLTSFGGPVARRVGLKPQELNPPLGIIVLSMTAVVASKIPRLREAAQII